MSNERAKGEREIPPIEAALRSAVIHGRNALAESAAAVSDLLEAASLGATGKPAAEQEALDTLVKGLDRARRLLEGDRPDAERWRERVSAALDAEIARWETRGRDDPEARAVLRAFLGVREVLWEFGLRAPAAPAKPKPAKARPGPRLQRVPVEG